jgi:hypothetical protein
MFNIHPFHQNSIIKVGENRQKLNNALEEEIKVIWEKEQACRNNSLFNELLFSVQDFSENHIFGEFVEYRLLIAQRIKPELYEFLRIRPLAVSGLLHSSSGIVFGQRHASMTQDSGLWELVPSGGISLSCKDRTYNIDINQQLLREIYEEINLAPSSILTTSPFCLVEDTETHVIDIGNEIVTSLDGNTIIQTHHLSSRAEYTNLKIICIADIPKFISQKKENIVGVSKILLQERGFAEAPD